MKKLLNIAFAGLFMALLFTSCSSDEEAFTKEYSNHVTSISIEETGLIFDSLGDSILKSHPSISTKWISPSQLRKAFRYAKTDARAAIAGANMALGFFAGGPAGGIAVGASAVVCGAMGSYLKWQIDVIVVDPTKAYLKKEINSIIKEYKTSRNETVDYITFNSIPAKSEYINIIGGMHNKILSDKMKESIEDTDSITNPDDQKDHPIGTMLTDPQNIQLCKSVIYNSYIGNYVTSLSEYNVIENSLLSSSDLIDSYVIEMESIYNQHITTEKDPESDEEFLESILFPEEEASKSYPKTIMNSYINAVFSVENYDMVIYLTNGFIEKSNEQITLSYEEKEQLFTFFTVFANSLFYWNSSLNE